MFNIEKYINFLNTEGLLPQAFAVVAGTLISNIIQPIIYEVIDPIINGEKPTLNIKKFALEILNFLIVTYILFMITDYIKDFKF